MYAAFCPLQLPSSLINHTDQTFISKYTQTTSILSIFLSTAILILEASSLHCFSGARSNGRFSQHCVCSVIKIPHLSWITCEVFNQKRAYVGGNAQLFVGIALF
ncbi:hypothetical protein BRADI_3g04496v3 [Brachypodium distachyon]|uniref:Uncharacterized protein n=1 Tax=Brachypodium distachyon TaxID=15368 RepID=A0A2K2CV75_BRADI|nr:hypothetical protein BRADI_3g04496v3 [Brachypodium distachyon]